MKKYEYKTFYMDRKHIEEPKKSHGLEVILNKECTEGWGYKETVTIGTMGFLVILEREVNH